MVVGATQSEPNDNTIGPWATGSVGEQTPVTLEALQNGLTVDLIATRRVDFVTCLENETFAEVVPRNRPLGFDFLPVLDQTSSRIVGLIEIAPFMHGAVPDARIGTVMHPLSEENLLGADASILVFIRDADHQKCRLIVSGHEISGLVSLSDLQRLPVRVTLFGLITYLEILMTDVIRQQFNGGDGWLDRISEGRRQKLLAEIAKARSNEPLIDALLFTQFIDKVNIIWKSGRFSVAKNQFESHFKKIQSLRDRLAHANDYAASPDAAIDTCKTVRLIDEWTDRLSKLL
jgi:hypothetical protein